MGLLLVVYLSFEALCRVGGLFFTFQRRPPVAIYLLGRDLFAWLFDCCLLCCEARKGVVSYM